MWQNRRPPSTPSDRSRRVAHPSLAEYQVRVPHPLLLAQGRKQESRRDHGIGSAFKFTVTADQSFPSRFPTNLGKATPEIRTQSKPAKQSWKGIGYRAAHPLLIARMGHPQSFRIYFRRRVGTHHSMSVYNPRWAATRISAPSLALPEEECTPDDTLSEVPCVP